MGFNEVSPFSYLISMIERICCALCSAPTSPLFTQVLWISLDICVSCSTKLIYMMKSFFSSFNSHFVTRSSLGINACTAFSVWPVTCASPDFARLRQRVTLLLTSTLKSTCTGVSMSWIVTFSSSSFQDT